MNIRHAFAGIAMTAALLSACASEPEYGDTALLGSEDREFVKQAAEANLIEIEAGRLAESKGSTRTVRDFGRQMVEDHREAQENLQELAEEKNVEIPSSINESQREKLSRLEELEGQEFDREFATMMVKDHEQAVSLFERHAKSAIDDDVRTYASETLPTLRHHLQMARELNTKVAAPSMY